MGAMKSMGRLDMLREVIAEQIEDERNMRFRHPWFSYMYNWIVLAAVVGLITSFVFWGVNIHTERKAEDMTAAALASYQAEQQAIADAQAAELAAVKASQEYVAKQEATAIAKVFYGIRLFIDKYGYDKSDLSTYARCIFNRVDAGNGVNSVMAIASQDQQFTGYSDDNPVLDEYYTLAMELVNAWHSEETKPCDASYRYAELTPDGIYLTDKFNAGPYDRRWHA